MYCTLQSEKKYFTPIDSLEYQTVKKNLDLKNTKK